MDKNKLPQHSHNYKVTKRQLVLSRDTRTGGWQPPWSFAKEGRGSRRCPLDFKQVCFSLVDTISEEHWDFERNGYELIIWLRKCLLNRSFHASDLQAVIICGPKM